MYQRHSAGTMKYHQATGVTKAHGIHLKECLYLVMLSGISLISFATRAENPSSITQYTLQREKTSEFVSSTLQSGERPEIEIVENSGVYKIKVVATIAAPASYVRYVLTDYKHIYRLNPSIIESEVLEQTDAEVTVRTKVVGCAAYFCEELDRVEKVTILQSGDIYAEIIPELSQFASGQTYWRIKQQGENSEVIYISEMEPDIYIPPVVGKFLIKKSIREGMLTSFRNLEKVSSILAAREWLKKDQTVAETISDSSCDNCVSKVDDSGE
jgi:hypothetical protein